MLRIYVSFKSGVVNLSRCCLSRPLRSFYLIKEVDTQVCDVYFEG